MSGFDIEHFLGVVKLRLLDQVIAIRADREVHRCPGVDPGEEVSNADLELLAAEHTVDKTLGKLAPSGRDGPLVKDSGDEAHDFISILSFRTIADHSLKTTGRFSVPLSPHPLQTSLMNSST